MEIKPIKTAADHSTALQTLDGLMSAELGTRQRDNLNMLTTLVKAYEATLNHFTRLGPQTTTAMAELRLE